ncbi:hypothetical protein MMMDOFMJ_1748 [Methylobacterium gnaphalii]|nr:hypothetical protein MMMDOFMJ_1748 [Methylobacterium gnaphalii]
MIDTTHLMPPDEGPRSNPILHGIAAAIAMLCPLLAPAPQADDSTSAESSAAEPADEASEGRTSITL